MFTNRKEAGRQLALSLKKYKDEQGIIMAVPRGGVPIAYEVAKKLHWPLEILLAKKLGHPNQKEYAVGAVGLENRIVIPHSDVPDEYIESETEEIRSRLREMRQKFMGNKQPETITGKTVILIDDGIATGTTLLASVKIVQQQKPARIVIAVPVAANRAVAMLSAEVDEMVVLYEPENFRGVGQFYEDFSQVSDEEVTDYINRLHEE